jgi:hypothetical protein
VKWRKLGLVIQPAGRAPWMQSHAMVPVAMARPDGSVRVYFAGRDERNRSIVSWAEMTMGEAPRVVRWALRPALGLGRLGCFDDNGVTPSWLVEHDGRLYLYYIGWNQGSTVRMHLVAGLAVSSDGGDAFERVQPVPILDRTPAEPYTLNTAPCVLREGGRWRLWYVSGVEWVHRDLPRYNIKYAESTDGVAWHRSGYVCIDFAGPDETSLGRPCVVNDGGRYRMWFSHKGPGREYRMGYAESADGLAWERADADAGLDVSPDGWDSQMVCYPFVFRHGGVQYMLYNGNDYGRDGAGLAVAE